MSCSSWRSRCPRPRGTSFIASSMRFCGKPVGVDSTTLEANAAMKSIVRRDTGDDYETYVKQLMAQEGIQDPSSEEVRRFDKQRQDKKVSNEEWVSESDPEACITKMKDG